MEKYIESVYFSNGHEKLYKKCLFKELRQKRKNEARITIDEFFFLCFDFTPHLKVCRENGRPLQMLILNSHLKRKEQKIM